MFKSMIDVKEYHHYKNLMNLFNKVDDYFPSNKPAATMMHQLAKEFISNDNQVYHSKFSHFKSSRNRRN